MSERITQDTIKRAPLSARITRLPKGASLYSDEYFMPDCVGRLFLTDDGTLAVIEKPEGAKELNRRTLCWADSRADFDLCDLLDELEQVKAECASLHQRLELAHGAMKAREAYEERLRRMRDLVGTGMRVQDIMWLIRDERGGDK